MSNPSQNGHAKDKDISSILEEWIFLVEEDAGVLARCCDEGLTVDLWSREGVEKGLKGKKVILVFKHVGAERAAEFEALGRVRAAEPLLLRVWKPYSLGDELTPNLKALATRYSLSELIWWEKPWEGDAPPVRPEQKRAGWACTDTGNAERMANRYGPVIRYCWPWKKWLTWNGQRWGQDDGGKVNSLAKLTVRNQFFSLLVALVEAIPTCDRAP